MCGTNEKKTLRTMSITINLGLLKRKQRADGTVPIYVRFTEKRKSRYKSTGYAIPEKDWNPKSQEVRRSHRDYKHLNIELGKIIREIAEFRDELDKQGRLSMKILTEQLFSGKKTDTRSIIETCDRFRDKLKADDRYWEHRHFTVTKSDIEKYVGYGASDRIDDLNGEWLNGFQRYLMSKNNDYTVIKKIQRLRGMIQWLKKTGQISHDPFIGFEKRTKPKNGETKTKLSIEQIKAIEELELENGSEIWNVRNYFMFSFFNAGVRFSDMCTLRWKNIVDGRLEYSMHKTSGHKSIKQLEPSIKILDHYRTPGSKPEDFIFPILDRDYSDPMELRRRISIRNVIVNKHLKTIANKAKIQAKVSFHVSRHSWAHFALTKGMDLYSISKALGHSDLKVTQDYIKSFDEQLLDKAMEGLFK